MKNLTISVIIKLHGVLSNHSIHSKSRSRLDKGIVERKSIELNQRSPNIHRKANNLETIRDVEFTDSKSFLSQMGGLTLGGSLIV